MVVLRVSVVTQPNVLKSNKINNDSKVKKRTLSCLSKATVMGISSTEKLGKGESCYLFSWQNSTLTP